MKSFCTKSLLMKPFFTKPCFTSKRALCRAIQPSDEIKLRRRLTWRRKSSKERSSKKNRELRNGISASKDSEALIGEQTEIELSGGKVEVSGPSMSTPEEARFDLVFLLALIAIT